MSQVPKHITTIGSLTVDLFVQPSETQIITRSTENGSESFFALPHGGKVSANHMQEHFGGGAANVGVSFARLENQVECLGGIGDDSNGQKILANLEKEKIGTEKIQKFLNINSGFSLILNSFDGERTVIFTSEANKEFQKIPEISSENDAIYLCHVSGKNPENIFAEIQKFLEKSPEKKFFWNPGHERISRGLEDSSNTTLLKHCDILFLNTEEAEEFSGFSAHKKISHAEEIANTHTLSSMFQKIRGENEVPDFILNVNAIAEKFLKKGVQTVVITDGKRGAQAFSKRRGEEYLFIPCVSSKRVDTLGAGDSFASAFSHFYLQGESLQKCGEYASVNAASVVANQGAQDGLLTKTQILQK